MAEANQDTFKDFPTGTRIETRHGIWITRELQANDPKLPSLLLSGWEPYAGSAILAPHPVNPQSASIMPIVFLRTKEDVRVAKLPNGNIEVLAPGVTPRVAPPQNVEAMINSIVDKPIPTEQ